MSMQIVSFVAVVGIGATAALDLWIVFLRVALGVSGTSWRVVGDWLCGLVRGRLCYRPRPGRAPGPGPHALGWAFHYLVGLLYAAAYPLVWGAALLDAPRLGPFLIIGVVVSSLAGLAILSPALGGGFFASQSPHRGRSLVLVVVNHGVFALAQYGLALALAGQ